LKYLKEIFLKEGEDRKDGTFQDGWKEGENLFEKKTEVFWMRENRESK